MNDESESTCCYDVAGEVENPADLEIYLVSHQRQNVNLAMCLDVKKESVKGVWKAG